MHPKRQHVNYMQHIKCKTPYMSIKGVSHRVLAVNKM